MQTSLLCGAPLKLLLGSSRCSTSVRGFSFCSGVLRFAVALGKTGVFFGKQENPCRILTQCKSISEFSEIPVVGCEVTLKTRRLMVETD